VLAFFSLLPSFPSHHCGVAGRLDALRHHSCIFRGGGGSSLFSHHGLAPRVRVFFPSEKGFWLSGVGVRIYGDLIASVNVCGG
jgi:hypothetical protein